MSFYLLLEDGVSKILLEDASGAVLLDEVGAVAPLAIVTSTVVSHSRRGR
jgi:hypothetical protein